MNINILSTPEEKIASFREFLLKRNPSEKFAIKYSTYLSSSLITSQTKHIAGVDRILDVINLGDLNKIYLSVKANSSNIRLHNVYSGVVSAYIKFLTGTELRKIASKNEAEQEL